MEDKAVISTQTGKRRKICIRNWPALCVGGIFCSGGIGWCLYTSLKQRPDNWRTTLAAFFVGATGISITHSVLFEASTKTGKPQKFSIRSWPTLCIGGIFCSGGVGWCLYRALKERPGNWMTTLAAFFVGATGISMTQTILWDGFQLNKHACQGRQRKDPLSCRMQEGMELETQPGFSMNLENLKIPETIGLIESDGVLYEKVCEILAKKISEVKEMNCDSCWKLCKSIYEALHFFKMGYVHCKPAPELSDLLQMALRQYRLEHGYRSVAEEYRRGINASFFAFQEQISSNFKEFETYAERVLLNRELPTGVHPVSIVSEDLASKFNLVQGFSEESIKKVVEIVSTLTLCLNRNLDAETGDFISSVYRTLEPPIKCPTELEFKRQVDRALLVRRF